MAEKSTREFDLIIVGGGIVGAFHAWFALQRGLKTLLIERNFTPRDASVRNFGTLVPSAMTAGDWHRRGVESLDVYKAMSRETGFPLNTNGSLYLALTEAERDVQEEFKRVGPAHGYTCELLEASEALKLNPALAVENIRSALYFPNDLRIESRRFLQFLLPWLQRERGLHLRLGTVAVRAEARQDGCVISTSTGEAFSAPYAAVCSGADFRTLFPEIFAASGLRKCLLHMCRTEPLPPLLPTTVASGLSMRWYSSFQICASWKKLLAEPTDPGVEEHGIHILLVQDADGSVIVGDSHHYSGGSGTDGGDFEERYQTRVEALIVQEARKLVRFPHWRIAERWLGVYPLHPERALFEEIVGERIHIVTGSAGKGMTCAPALGRETIARIFGAK